MNAALAIAPRHFAGFRVRPILAGALLLLAAFWPVWRWYGLRLNDGSDEPWGLVALGLAGWILWQHRERLTITRGGAVTAAILLLGYAVGFPHLPASIRALVAIAAIGAFAGIHRAPAATWGLLVLSLPVIATAQFFGGWPLRLITAAGSEFLLSLGGLEVTREATVLWWKGSPVAVDPPCSGIRMLWAGLFAHFALGAIHHLKWRSLLWLTPLALFAVILANVIRAALLFFQESGAVHLPHWTHAGIGLAVFGLMLAAFAISYPRLAPGIPEPETTREKATPGRPLMTVITMLAFFAALAPLSRGRPAGSADLGRTDFPGWPASFEGEALDEIPFSKQEASFAEQFPGRLGAFETASGRKIILRWVTRPTRKLHSSADCFRATGFTVETRSGTNAWATWAISHPDQGDFTAREQIRETTPGKSGTWTEPSAWFWSASFRQTRGPWWAITVIDPVSEP